MRIVLKSKSKIGMPRFLFPRPFWDDVARITEASTLENIKKQRTITGGTLKRNSPQTRERKRQQGRPALALVDEQHRFVKGGKRSWAIARYLPNGSGVVIGGATAELRRLTRYVAEMGYVGWLGLHPASYAAIRALIRREVIKQFKAAARRGRRK